MKRLLAIVLLAGLGPSCGPGSLGLLFYFNLLATVNVTDTFTLTGISTGVSGSRTYYLNCTTDQANLAIGTTLTSGSIRLQVLDGNGKEVHDNRYEATLLGGLTAFTSSKGHAGLWTLKFSFHNAIWTGDLTLTADKTPDPDVIDIGGTGSLDTSWTFNPGWTAADVNVTVGGMTDGIVHIRLWDGNGDKVLDQFFFGISGSTVKANGAAGHWTAQIVFDSCISVGAVTLGQ